MRRSTSVPGLTSALVTRLAARVAALGAITFAIALAAAVQPAAASVFEMTLTNADFRYSGVDSAGFDLPDLPGGNLDGAEADALFSTTIAVDNVVTHTIFPSDTDMFADIEFDGLPSSIDFNTFVMQTLPVSGFGVDWFTNDGDHLRLNVSSVEVLTTSTVFFLSAQAVIEDQLLPDNLTIGGPVEIAYVASNPLVQTSGGDAIDVVASGTLSIKAIVIPEPTAALLALAALAMPTPRRRR